MVQELSPSVGAPPHEQLRGNVAELSGASKRTALPGKFRKISANLTNLVKRRHSAPSGHPADGNLLALCQGPNLSQISVLAGQDRDAGPVVHTELAQSTNLSNDSFGLRGIIGHFYQLDFAAIKGIAALKLTARHKHGTMPV